MRSLINLTEFEPFSFIFFTYNVNYKSDFRTVQVVHLDLMQTRIIFDEKINLQRGKIK